MVFRLDGLPLVWQVVLSQSIDELKLDKLYPATTADVRPFLAYLGWNPLAMA